MTDRALQTYLEWLAPQVKVPRQRDFSELFGLMQAKEFVWVVGNDDNRIQDARDLRAECFRQFDVKPYVTTDVLGPVSVLEILIALSHRMEFMTSESADTWAWCLLVNLELKGMSGHIGPKRAAEIDDTLERLVWRTYEPDGVGGFFPLAWPEQDQRKVELWYQLGAYLAENQDPH